MIVIVVLFACFLVCFGVSLIYRSGIILFFYKTLIVGVKSGSTFDVNFTLNLSTICFVILLGIAVLAYCFVVMLVFLFNNRGVTLLGIILSLLIFLFGITVGTFVVAMLVDSGDSLQGMFQYREDEDENDLKTQIEFEFACCGFDNETTQQQGEFYCKWKSDAKTVWCKDSVYKPFMQSLGMLLMPIVFTLIAAAVGFVVLIFLFRHQKLEFKNDEWGDEFYG
ncbi:hypothetical protein EIN_224490 [Entamoeba invadens IP1]|uniref:Tetraspanin family protein n=1 Tax=Entamoeba invadens IP1 TaxID=370355 RepID=A0A0A1U2A7_ENTIV|nr:hypothetical protein EIN_224490 [Entamoeba invadens IP1]ELP88206.1 hypothetical protein EIN_224490 [Entamoeba invadens IP1]|eukprot:XP_004254977.1 hypothetical protein EIN_224490 [Entamoeba invadens IP1]